MMEDATEIATLKASAAAGDRWYDGPEHIEPGAINVTVALALFGAESMTAYDVSFEWDRESAFAPFVLGVAEGEAQALGAYSPIHGWIAWNDDSLVLAYQWPEEGRQDARVIKRIDEEAEPPEDGDPVAWALMARRLVEIALGDR